MVSRDDMADELYKLAGPHKTAEAMRVLRIVERYALAKSRQIVPMVDPFYKLKPGDTDLNHEGGAIRKCLSCGEIKYLYKDFGRDPRAPYRKRLRCRVCRPDTSRSKGHYVCKGCGEDKPLDEYPKRKQENPRITCKCLVCKPEVAV